MEVEVLKLKDTSPWKLPKSTFNYHCQKYGKDLGTIINEYTEVLDPKVFDNNRDIIRKHIPLYKDNQSVSSFVYRLAKIIHLYKYWWKYRSWGDPLIARHMYYYQGRKAYIVHPGQDRWIIMRHYKVTEYPFLVLSQEEYNNPDTANIIKTKYPNFNLTWEERSMGGSHLVNKNWLREDIIDIINGWIDHKVTGNLSPISCPYLITARASMINSFNKKGP